MVKLFIILSLLCYAIIATETIKFEAVTTNERKVLPQKVKENLGEENWRIFKEISVDNEEIKNKEKKKKNHQKLKSYSENTSPVHAATDQIIEDELEAADNFEFFNNAMNKDIEADFFLEDLNDITHNLINDEQENVSSTNYNVKLNSKNENNQHYYQNIFFFIFVGGTIGLCIYYIYTLHQTHEPVSPNHTTIIQSGNYPFNSTHHCQQHRSKDQTQNTYHTMESQKYSPTISQPQSSSAISTKEIKHSQSSPHYTSEMYNLSTSSFTYDNKPLTTTLLDDASIMTSNLTLKPIYMNYDTKKKHAAGVQQQNIPFQNHSNTSF